MFRKTALVLSAFSLLIWIAVAVNFFAKGKLLFEKNRFLHKDKVQETEKTDASLSATIGEETMQVSPTPDPSVRGEAVKLAYRELNAKMKGDVGFDAVILPVKGAIDKWDFKVLIVKAPSARRIQTVEIQLPRGWIFKPGGDIGQKEVIGGGKANMLVDDSLRDVTVRVVNDQETDNHIARWKLYFGSVESPSRVLDGFIDGDEQSGFRVNISKSLAPGEESQARFEFHVNSVGDGKSAVFSGSGDITGKARATIRFFDGSSVELEN